MLLPQKDEIPRILMQEKNFGQFIAMVAPTGKTSGLSSKDETEIA
jgi:hypothetical protein